MKTQSEKLLFSINDAAYALSICRASVYNEINAGRLQFIQHGKRKFISRQALEAWIRDRELETQGHKFEYRIVKGEHRDCA